MNTGTGLVIGAVIIGAAVLGSGELERRVSPQVVLERCMEELQATTEREWQDVSLVRTCKSKLGV